jgi:hypothetical protein
MLSVSAHGTVLRAGRKRLHNCDLAMQVELDCAHQDMGFPVSIMNAFCPFLYYLSLSVMLVSVISLPVPLLWI